MEEQQQCAVKLTAEEVNKSIALLNSVYFWRERAVERIWVQGYVLQHTAKGSFVLSDTPESSSPQDPCCQLDVFAAAALKTKDSEPSLCSQLTTGDYVLVVGKLRAGKSMKSSSSSNSLLIHQPATKRLGVHAHKVIKLPGDSQHWQQLWMQEISHLHNVVYPRTWQLSQ